MNKGFLASCFVMITAAALGYWIWSDAAPAPKAHRERSDLSNPTPTTAAAGSSTSERFSAGEFVEIIDMARLFEPTGGELNLQNLLRGLEETESLPAPRLADPEPLPAPRLVGPEALHLPRMIATGSLPDAAEEASSPPTPFEKLCSEFRTYFAHRYTEIVSRMQSPKRTRSLNDDDD